MNDRDERDQVEDVVEYRGWMMPEIQAALNRIRGEHVGKMRTSVIRLAFARALGTPLADVFALEDVVSESIWYMKWLKLETVQTAFDLCYERALDWRDEETGRVEAGFANERRQVIAELSVTAVRGLALTALQSSDRADHRTEASKVLLRLADPELGARLADEKGQALPVEVEGLDALIEQQLDRVAGGEGERAEG